MTPDSASHRRSTRGEAGTQASSSVVPADSLDKQTLHDVPPSRPKGSRQERHWRPVQSDRWHSTDRFAANKETCIPGTDLELASSPSACPTGSMTRAGNAEQDDQAAQSSTDSRVGRHCASGGQTLSSNTNQEGHPRPCSAAAFSRFCDQPALPTAERDSGLDRARK